MSLFSGVHKLFISPLRENRSGYKTGPHLRLLKESENWSCDQLREFQLNRVKLMVAHAYANSPFYRQRFDQIGFEPNNLNSLGDMEKIPPINREDLNENLESMKAVNVSEDQLHYATTGGSTGLATRFARDNACISIKKASEYRFNTWAGWKPGDKILYYWVALSDFSKNPQIKLKKAALYSRSLSLYAGKLNKEILGEHVDAFKRFKPHLIRAFPSALEKFAEHVKSSGLHVPTPKGIITLGEPLLENQRTLFQNVFECDVFNCYVSRECGNLACECSSHEGLHVAEELVHVEVQSSQAGDHGELLITDLWNMGMPFIRYSIQDAARWNLKACSCGKHHKLLGLDAARLSDFLISPLDGSYVSGSTLTHYLLAEGPKVGRAKLIQTKPDHLLVLIAGTPESSRETVEHMRSRLGIIFKGAMKVDFEFKENIPLLPSGKYSFVERRF